MKKLKLLILFGFTVFPDESFILSLLLPLKKYFFKK